MNYRMIGIILLIPGILSLLSTFCYGFLGVRFWVPITKDELDPSARSATVCMAHFIGAILGAIGVSVLCDPPKHKS